MKLNNEIKNKFKLSWCLDCQLLKLFTELYLIIISPASFNDRVTDLQRLQKIKPISKRDRSFSRVSIATLREHRFSRSTLFKPMPPVNHTGTASGNNLNTLVVCSLSTLDDSVSPLLSRAID